MSNPKTLTILAGEKNTSKPTFEVITGGIETTIQDGWSRKGYLGYGIPPSGPLDKLSFQLGNQLLGNQENAAGLEIQFIGPKLKFLAQTAIAITGANNYPAINHKPVPLWQTLAVYPGDILSFGHARIGARSYITFAGGINVPTLMGSRSTFIKAELGGFQGRSLKLGDTVTTFVPNLSLAQIVGKTLPTQMIPEFTHRWVIEVMLGPHDDFLTPQDIKQFLSFDWIVSTKSNRIGYRLEGAEFQFTETVRERSAKGGYHPSNQIDYGCSVGSVLLCGQTPTILLADCPSLTGYITPFTVINHSLRKVGQARPGDIINFRQVSLAEAIQTYKIATNSTNSYLAGSGQRWANQN